MYGLYRSYWKPLLRPVQFIAVVPLLFAFLWDSAGSSCLESLHQWHRNQQLKFQSELAGDTLVIPYVEYARLTARDCGEIEYQGRMYDICHAVPVGDQMMLTGHFDDFDKELFKVLDFLLGHDDAGDADTLQRSGIFVFTAVLPRPISLFASFHNKIHCSYTVQNDELRRSPLPEVLTAPPEA